MNMRIAITQLTIIASTSLLSGCLSDMSGVWDSEHDTPFGGTECHETSDCTQPDDSCAVTLCDDNVCIFYDLHHQETLPIDKASELPLGKRCDD
jgi:hypothetical protein